MWPCTRRSMQAAATAPAPCTVPSPPHTLPSSPSASRADASSAGGRPTPTGPSCPLLVTDGLHNERRPLFLLQRWLPVVAKVDGERRLVLAGLDPPTAWSDAGCHGRCMLHAAAWGSAHTARPPSPRLPWQAHADAACRSIPNGTCGLHQSPAFAFLGRPAGCEFRAQQAERRGQRVAWHPVARQAACSMMRRQVIGVPHAWLHMRYVCACPVHGCSCGRWRSVSVRCAGAPLRAGALAVVPCRSGRPHIAAPAARARALRGGRFRAGAACCHARAC